MNSLTVRFSVALLVAFALGGCGFTSSPAEGLLFKAPPGWSSSPGILGMMQFWQSPSRRHELLMLFRSPRLVSPDDIFSSAGAKDRLQHVSIHERRAIEICGHQPATYVEGTGTSSSDGDEDVQAVVTEVKGTTYFAMYLHPAGVTPNPDATAALRTICAKS